MSRIVIVDDHPVFRKGLAALLRSDGHDVVAEASDGVEAIALVEQERPDLVLMDLSMPIRDGFEATAQITARHPDTRVVVITLFDDEASVVRALQAGASGYVSKQADPDQINVHPLPAQERILDGFARLGFRFKGADLERGHLRGVRQTLPFYQEIEFYPAPQYARAMNQLEVTFVANPASMVMVLELDKRGGLLTEGHDTLGAFTVDYATAGQVNWEQQLDGWLQQACKRRGLFF